MNSSSPELDLDELLRMFRCSTANPKASTGDTVLEKCLQLFQLDHPDYLLIHNENGLLSSYYPSKMMIPQRSGTEPRLESEVLTNLITRGRIARCRTRFPVPVILYKDRYICRSATLSGGPEIYGRTGLDLFFPNNSDSSGPGGNSFISSPSSNANAEPTSTDTSNTTTNTTTSNSKVNDSPIFDGSHVFSYARNQDINLLKYLSVGLICDLMVEKKKVKFCFYVTSSEKADKRGRYKEFGLLCLPYPGCEFFQIMREAGYNLTGVKYNWNQQFVDAELLIPSGKLPLTKDIEWEKYKSWDIIELTKSYLKLLLRSLKENKESILIHCISGWDRTPLFICLLRLSLWADGQIHQHLSPREITYFTLAYDWYLFGHDLSDRISRGEEILFFCFYFLRYIEGNEFTVNDCENHTTQLDISSREETAETADAANSQHRTKPVEIPTPHGSTSKTPRKDGFSPCLARSDSWQIVSPSEGITDPSHLKQTAQGLNISQEPASTSSPSSSQIFSISPSSSSSPNLPRRLCFSCVERKSRLQEVRSFFFNSYSTTVLSHGNEVPKPILSYLTDHFTTSLSFTSATRVKAPN